MANDAICTLVLHPHMTFLCSNNISQADTDFLFSLQASSHSSIHTELLKRNLSVNTFVTFLLSLTTLLMWTPIWQTADMSVTAFLPFCKQLVQHKKGGWDIWNTVLLSNVTASSEIRSFGTEYLSS